MEKKQSSIDWLVEMVSKMGYVSTDIIEQVKAMHKEEMIDAYQAGDGDAYNLEETRMFGEQYYNERFGGNNE
jgi:hypothetical protein